MLLLIGISADECKSARWQLKTAVGVSLSLFLITSFNNLVPRVSLLPAPKSEREAGRRDPGNEFGVLSLLLTTVIPHPRDSETKKPMIAHKSRSCDNMRVCTGFSLDPSLRRRRQSYIRLPRVSPSNSRPLFSCL